jgi:hypothetical protein
MDTWATPCFDSANNTARNSVIRDINSFCDIYNLFGKVKIWLLVVFLLLPGRGPNSGRKIFYGVVDWYL